MNGVARFAECAAAVIGLWVEVEIAYYSLNEILVVVGMVVFSDTSVVVVDADDENPVREAGWNLRSSSNVGRLFTWDYVGV